ALFLALWDRAPGERHVAITAASPHVDTWRAAQASVGAPAAAVRRPDEPDGAALRVALQRAAAALGLAVPEVEIAATPGIHPPPRAERRSRAEPIFQRALARLGRRAAAATLEWSDAGAPQIRGAADTFVSISHTDDACLCVVGATAQGCDLVPVKERT